MALLSSEVIADTLSSILAYGTTRGQSQMLLQPTNEWLMRIPARPYTVSASLNYTNSSSALYRVSLQFLHELWNRGCPHHATDKSEN
jgi:hypothetical protein